MKIDFDPTKDAVNRDKHGVSLGFGEQVFADPRAITLHSIRPQDGEDRSKIIGMIDVRLWTAVYVERGDTIRFISVRKSNDAETKGYHRHTRGSE